jgi:hypothetical protein
MIDIFPVESLLSIGDTVTNAGFCRSQRISTGDRQLELSPIEMTKSKAISNMSPMSPILVPHAERRLGQSRVGEFATRRGTRH